MKTVLSILCLAFSLIQIGCGGNPINPNSVSSSITGATSVPPPAQAVNLDQSWHFVFQFAGNGALTMEAALVFSGSSVSGTAHATLDTGIGTCLHFEDEIPITGTVDSANQVHLSGLIEAGYGPTLTIDATLSSDRTLMVNGKYQMTKSCAEGYSGALTAVMIPAIQGHYVGSLNKGAATIAVTADLAQAKVAGNTGYFPLTGNLSLSGPECSGTFNVGGFGIGNYFKLGSNVGSDLAGFSARSDPTGQQLAASDYPYSDDCIAGYQGVLQRQ